MIYINKDTHEQIDVYSDEEAPPTLRSPELQEAWVYASKHLPDVSFAGETE